MLDFRANEEKKREFQTEKYSSCIVVLNIFFYLINQLYNYTKFIIIIIFYNINTNVLKYTIKRRRMGILEKSLAGNY